MITNKAYTDQGGRECNEDFGVSCRKKDIFYAVLADGLGGHGNGDKASKTAVMTIVDCIREFPEPQITEEKLVEWFEEANQKVLAMQTEACRMKTTLALLCINEKERIATLAHIGDSRIYHFENGKCVFYTFDHSVSRMSVLAGEIEMQDIRFHTDRNKLLKAIGKSKGVKAETSVISLCEYADHAFLLCSDGFWEYVTEEEMEQTLADAKTVEEWLERMRTILMQKVKENNDNNSAIAIWVKE